MNEDFGFKLSEDDAKELGIALVGIVLGIIGLMLNGRNVRDLVCKGLSSGDS